MSIPVSIPAISKLLFLPSGNKAVVDIRRDIWKEVEERLRWEGKEVEISNVSLRSLVSGLQN
jgi:hypothetical protein